MSETDIAELAELLARCHPGSKARKPLEKLVARLTAIDRQWEVYNRELETRTAGDPAHGRDLDREVEAGSLSQSEAQALRKASIKHRDRFRAVLTKQVRRIEALVKEAKLATREFIEATIPELRNASPKERLELFSQRLDQARGLDPQAVDETKMGLGLLLIREFTPSEESTQIN